MKTKQNLLGICLLAAVLLPTVVQADCLSYPFYYTVNNNSATITGYVGLPGAVNIPSAISSYTVTGISANIFNQLNPGYQNQVSSISIPDTVTNIDPYTFANCYVLTTITVNATNPAYSSVGGV
jgi:hypothetical protein